jgi:hypothetical protein
MNAASVAGSAVAVDEPGDALGSDPGAVAHPVSTKAANTIENIALYRILQVI